jgi:hypothetical protein
MRVPAGFRAVPGETEPREPRRLATGFRSLRAPPLERVTLAAIVPTESSERADRIERTYRTVPLVEGRINSTFVHTTFVVRRSRAHGVANRSGPSHPRAWRSLTGARPESE